MNSETIESLIKLYFPAAKRIKNIYDQKASTIIVGISGGQGSGKTTAAKILCQLLHELELTVIRFSIDDLYKSLAEREMIREKNAVNPYFKNSRGNPGTHDVDLGIKIIESLKNADENTITKIPLFDKSFAGGKGERFTEEKWLECKGRPDVVIFEGWLVGHRFIPKEKFFELKSAIPEKLIEFEKRYDPHGEYGWIVNQKLSEYENLFDLIDFLIYLKVPNVDKIFEWRKLQEKKMIEQTGCGMSEAEVEDFIKPFLLLTCIHGLKILGDCSYGLSDVIVEIGEDHLPRQIIECFKEK